MSESAYERLASALLGFAPPTLDAEPKLHAALNQIISRPGKLVRGQMVFLAACSHGLRQRPAEALACAVEYFHAASLVLDDLPCMDDAAQRRGLPCIHRKHGDATAILVALALINRAYSLVASAFEDQSTTVRTRARLLLDEYLGVGGLVGGQAWDLAFSQTDGSPRVIGRIAARKTGALLSLAVELPAALARPSLREQRALRALCVYWGQMFQIADDLLDLSSPAFLAGKTTGRDQLLQRPNLAVRLGIPETRRRLGRLAAQADRALTILASKRGRRWHYLRTTEDLLRRALAMHQDDRSAAA
jgi:geranylgeranyl pyrophosphate synthase